MVALSSNKASSGTSGRSMPETVDLSTLCPYTRLKIKKEHHMTTTTTKRKTWTGDVAAACEAAGLDNYGYIFNDRHLTCRRLKFCVTPDLDNGGKLTDEHCAKMQEVIQARRPDLNVTVSRWETNCGWQGFGNVVVYYRPKTGRYMNH